ncbi:MAG: hypothetical protein AAF673_00495 [Pseudomonadota bacterium]
MLSSKSDYFKRYQRDSIYHYIKVVGGPGRTKDGFQEVINFLNNTPIINLQINYEADPSGLTGSWCNWEIGERITKSEYDEAYKRATSGRYKIYINNKPIKYPGLETD